MVSPLVKVKVSLEPSVVSHFMLFPGVICPNSLVLLKSARYWASVSSTLSVAQPK